MSDDLYMDNVTGMLCSILPSERVIPIQGGGIAYWVRYGNGDVSIVHENQLEFASDYRTMLPAGTF